MNVKIGRGKMIDLDTAVAGVTGDEDRAELGPVDNDLDGHAKASTRKPCFLERSTIMGPGIGIVVVVFIALFVSGFVAVILSKP